MEGILGDRYLLLGLAVVSVILMTVFINGGEVQEDDGTIIGFAYDVSQTKKGYVFSFEDSEGSRMSCFFHEEPACDKVYGLKGRLSDDGSMFFVSSMKEYTLE